MLCWNLVRWENFNYNSYLWQESFFHMLICSNGCLTDMVIRTCESKATCCPLLSCFITICVTLCLDWLLLDGKHPGCDHSFFGRREFSFTLANDIYLRFQSFNSLSEMENAIKEKCPVKIDIGPVYSVDVKFLYLTFSFWSLSDWWAWLVAIYLAFLSDYLCVSLHNPCEGVLTSLKW